MQLTQEQQDAVAFGIEHLSQGRPALIQGQAGTGKTTCLKAIHEHFNYRTIITAPTHKAVKVLESKLGSRGHFSTIHSLEKLSEKRIKDKVVFSRNSKMREGLLPRDRHIIIDEASMISNTRHGKYDSLLEILILSARDRNNTFLFVGDDHQLNPVGEDSSPIFELGIPTFTLHQIQRRAAENDNTHLSRNLDLLKSKAEGNFYSWNKKAEGLKRLVESNGTDSCKFITWTNATVKAINDYVRSQIHGSNPDPFYVGETIVFNAPYEAIIGGYKNNQELVIRNVRPDREYGYNIWRINDEILVLQDSDIEAYKDKLEDLRQRALAQVLPWGLFYKHKNMFANVQHNHAITVHKSQGSTYNDSIVNVSEILQNPNLAERERMLYTAVTRCSNFNYFV